MDPQASPRQSSSAAPAVDAQYVQSQMQALYAQVQQSLAAAQSSASASSRATPRVDRDLPRIRQPSQFVGAMGFGVDDWISEMSQQFSYYGASFPDDAARIRFAASFLGGPAMHWWEQEPDRASVGDWSEFVRRLHGRFRPVQAAMLARQRLGKLSQRGGQTVNQYTSAFQITMTPIVDMGDADQVHHYVNGLLGAIAGKVWERHPKTLKEAIDFAVSVEAMANYGRAAAQSTSSSGYRSSYSGSTSSQHAHHTSAPMEVNHVEAVGDNEPKYDREESEIDRDPFRVMLAKMESMEQRLNALHRSSSSSASTDGRRDQDRSLISDLKPGDLARLQKDGKCFRCKQKGHMKNECPQRPKNM